MAGMAICYPEAGGVNTASMVRMDSVLFRYLEDIPRRLMKRMD